MLDLSIIDSIAILSINNQKKLNVLSTDLMNNINDKVCGIDQKARVLLITGNAKAFAAGVDISEIESLSYEDACLKNFIDCKWESIFNVKIPTIAAVSGYALGGGFELALMCDIIIAAENSKFGFPEVNLGLMPGMGGTQMLTRTVGSKLASEIIMTGDFITAHQAKELGIVSRITKDNELMQQALSIAQKIAQKSILSLKMIKDSIRVSQNTGLFQGMQCERQMFRSLFSTEDKKQSVKKFLEKR